MPVELTDADKKLLHDVTERFEQSENHRRPYVDRWDRLVRRYVLYNDFARTMRETAEPDRDSILSDGKREWGADLKTPWAFAIVETLVPRMVAHRPNMLIHPRRKASMPDVDVEANAESMRFLIDAQQEQIEYDLKLQTTIKTGLIYGLGIQKSYWRYEECVERQLRKKIIGSGWVPGKAKLTVKHDDPWVDDLDIWDFFWDPFASDTEGMEWAIHRSWRSTRYVLDRLQTSWKHTVIPDDDLRGSGAAERYSEAHEPRMRAEGVTGDWEPRGDEIHEVWEFHDGREVVTVLDRQWIVQQGPNPYWHGELPFYAFRPSERPHRFVGTGAIEPIEHLIAEMDTFRSQRLDNATIRLNAPFAYAEGMVDPDDIVFGPGIGIPVNGSPDEVLKQLVVGDIPNSSYQEMAAMKDDIQLATGLSEPVVGGQQPSTATGAQLAVQVAGERTKLMTRRAESELIRRCAKHFGRMNQQKIRDEKRVYAFDQNRRWTWRDIGPEQLLGEFAYVPEGGSTEPENVPQMRQDAQILGQLQNHPNVDQDKLLLRRMKLMGIEQPEDLIIPDQKISSKVLDVFKQFLIGDPAEEGDAQLVVPDPESPTGFRELHPEEADQLIEMALQQVEQMTVPQGEDRPGAQ